MARVESASGRKFFLGLETECCACYDGRMHRVKVEGRFNPGPTFGATLSEEWLNVTLPGGRTVIRTDSLDAQLNFSARMTMHAQLQYDNVSKAFASAVQFRWELSPLTDVFAVLGESSRLIGPVYDAGYHSFGTTFLVRVGHRPQF
jgi:hypothetical protein